MCREAEERKVQYHHLAAEAPASASQMEPRTCFGRRLFLIGVVFVVVVVVVVVPLGPNGAKCILKYKRYTRAYY